VRFTPGRALVTVTGRFDPNDARALIQARLGAPRPAGAPPKPAAPSWAPVVPRSAAGLTALPVPVVLAGWRLPPDRDADAAALQVLAHLLTEGANPRLERALVTAEGPFVQTQGNFERRSDACVFVVAAAVKGAIDTAAVESQLTHEVERWASEPLTAADLEPAQRTVEAELLSVAQTPAGRAETLASAQILDGDWRAWEQRVARVRALTPADVQRAASRALVAAHRAIVWTAPAMEGRRP
jgi:zinc protease